jgi:hypothetical protein
MRCSDRNHELVGYPLLLPACYGVPQNSVNQSILVTQRIEWATLLGFSVRARHMILPLVQANATRICYFVKTGDFSLNKASGFR